MEEFSQDIKKYHEAIESEFNMVRAGDIDSMTDLARQQLATHLLTFVRVIADVAEGGETDAVRLAASKFGITFVLGKENSDGKAISPMQALIDRLTKNDE